MALMNRFLKTKKQPSATPSQTTEDLSVELLKQLIPIRNLSDEELESFALENKAEVLPAKSLLFTAGDPIDAVVFLLRGTVSLIDSQGNCRDIEAETLKAKFPLASGIKHITTGKAKTPISMLRVSPKIMTLDKAKTEHARLDIPKQLANSRLLQVFSESYMDDELEIPTLPRVAIQLRKAMQKDIGIAEAVEIIQLDPVISAKLIQVANCPLYLTVTPVKTCFDAVSRIGLHATRNLVTSLSIKHTFTQKSPLIAKFLDRVWKRSIYISCISYVLASITRQINPEEALLAGLICDIGAVPFLNFAANLPGSYYTEQDLTQALPHVSGPVGYTILRNWDFPEEFLEIPRNSTDWMHSEGEQLTLNDIVLLSRMHSKIGTPAMADLPAITSVPAASKLEKVSLSPENSLHILYEAKSKINEALQVFSI